MWSLLRYSCRLVQLSDMKGGSWVFVEKKKNLMDDKVADEAKCLKFWHVVSSNIKWVKCFSRASRFVQKVCFWFLPWYWSFQSEGIIEKNKKKRQEILAGNKSMLKNFYFIFFPRLNELKTDCEDNSLHSKCNMRQKLRQLLAWVAKQRRQPEGSREAIRRLKSKLLTGSICATLSPEKLLSRWFNVNS